MYPDLKVEWRTVISRYNYHFGGIDEQENALKKRNSDFSREGSIDKSIVTSPDASNDAETLGNSHLSYGAMTGCGMNDIEKDTNNESTNIDELHESSLDDSNFRSNVKGFRNWTTRMQQELVETKNRLTQEHPDLVLGSTDFNHLLLREFQKLNPKCMESSRSIYSKLQSIEKTLNSPLSDNTATSKCWSAINQSTEGNTPNSDPAQMNNECVAFNGESTTRLRDSPVHEGQTDGTHSSGKNSITKKHEIPSDNTNKLDSNEDEQMIPKSNENSTIEGFQDWTLGMIRDFISCMDTARRRHAELRENQPNEQVKLVPLLLEEWRSMYPSSTETVKTFLVKIKHLKLQKDVIKKHLVGGGNTATSSTDNADPNGLGFKWNRDMIQDVIDSRRRALDIKDNALAQGKKLSFHALWASEFKKVYPTSTFTSNNLSVHFWTWRKQQLKKKRLSKKATAPSDASTVHSTLVLGNGNSNSNLEQSKDAKVYNAPGPWSKLYKKQLLEVGRRVEHMLQGKDTPNEVKLEGFANILHAEWKKVQKATNGTKQDVSARAINMMYSRLLREKDPSLYSNEASLEPIKHLTTNNNDDVLDDVDSRITATWTPKHNRVLRECMEGKLNDGIDQNPISNAVLTDRIIKEWRKKFPKSSISDDNLSRRITDSMFNLEAAHVSSSSGKIQKHLDTNDTKEYLTIKEEKPLPSSASTGNLGSIDSDTQRLPNRKGQMIWNKESIVDLFKTHHETKEHMKNGRIVTKNDSRQMAYSLQKSFVKRYPHCRLSAVMLLAKYYKLQNEIASGNLDINLPNFEDSKIKTEDIKFEAISNPTSNMEIDCNTNNVNTALNKETGMRDLVFRTWTQEMIDDMLKTRSIAIAKKKTRSQKDPCDPITITDLWYDEFLKCHPNYKSTKKNLWRKYKWYMSRIRANPDKHFGVDNASCPSSGKDTLLHENKLIGNSIKTSKMTKEEADEESAARLKPIRKDVFHFIKAVLEESRIFLPMKLPEDPLMKKYQEKHGKEIPIRAGGKTTPCDKGMAMVLETTGTEHHGADNYTTISALVKTNEVQPNFPSNLNVPNLSCLNTDDLRPSSRTSTNVTLQQMFAPSQPLITSVPKLPASVTVTPRLSDTATTEEHGNKGGKNTSEGKRSSIKLPGNLSLPLLDNGILTISLLPHIIR